MSSSAASSNAASSSSSSRPATPILDCTSYRDILITPSLPPAHPHQSPTFALPATLEPHVRTAAAAIRAGQTVAFPTETVYGLGASSLDAAAVRSVYRIKGRPSDNPLIMHVSSLSMLSTVLPPAYALSELYDALVAEFWPGPLTLLFPSACPAAPPAPPTYAIRMPAHALALALIDAAGAPVSAPSANASGRPSPTAAQHVAHDLAGADGLVCILDGGPCGVGLESTVVDGLRWRRGGGGTVDVLRPGGLGVEHIERVVRAVDAEHGGMTQILFRGQPWVPGRVDLAKKLKTDAPPSTPGQKYRHYSPSLPVYLLYPSTTFALAPPSTAPGSVAEIVAHVARATGKDTPSLGLLHFDDSPLARTLLADAGAASIAPRSLGADATSAAHRLFSGLLGFEQSGIDAILVEGCKDDGLGLAVMERVGKAVGGGGVRGQLDGGEGDGVDGRFWVQL
ncbi:hypothetical protein Q5752_005244 [Cryptotrichosporon argae]